MICLLRGLVDGHKLWDGLFGGEPEVTDGALGYILFLRSMKQGASSLRDFELVSKLGEGSFAEVFKMRRKEDGQYYAVKKVTLHSHRSACQRLSRKTGKTL